MIEGEYTPMHSDAQVGVIFHVRRCGRNTPTPSERGNHAGDTAEERVVVPGGGCSNETQTTHPVPIPPISHPQRPNVQRPRIRGGGGGMRGSAFGRGRGGGGHRQVYVRREQPPAGIQRPQLVHVHEPPPPPRRSPHDARQSAPERPTRSPSPVHVPCGPPPPLLG